MFDYDSKLIALVQNYGLAYLMEENEISEEYVVRFLVDEGLIDFDDYFNVDAEMEHWKEQEE